MKKLIFILLLFPAIAHSAIWYCDPDYGGGNGASNGSFSRPFTTIAQINAQAKSAGDDLYFKAGSRLVAAHTLTINWSGSSANRVIIGSYRGENDFVVPLAERAIIDGNSHTVPAAGSWSGLVQHLDRAGYVTIQDLQVIDSGGVGISLGQSFQSTGVYSYTNAYYVVQRCYVHRPWRQAILIARSSYNLVASNQTYFSSWGHNQPDRVTGASIEVTAMHNELLSQHNVIRNNTVSLSNYEGIGMYKQARYTTVENNTVRDCGTYNIYITRSRDQIIRNNIVYATSEAVRYPSRGYGIVVSMETDAYQWGVPWGGQQIYGNYLGGLYTGIMIATHLESYGFGPVGTRVYANRIVDCGYSYQFNRDNIYWSDIEYSANYSFIYTADLLHSNKFSPIGVTWSGNYFKTPPSVSGNAMTGAFYNQVTLQKTTGWRTLMPGAVTKEDFAFSGETGSCSTNPLLCDAVGCSEYWPDYYFCDGVCQSQTCATTLTCATTPSLCDAAGCATYWPTYIYENGQCLPPGFEPTPFANKPLRPSSLHLPWRPTSTLPPLDTRSGERQ